MFLFLFFVSALPLETYILWLSAQVQDCNTCEPTMCVI